MELNFDFKTGLKPDAKPTQPARRSKGRSFIDIHRELAIAILKVVPDESECISNAQIKEVQNIAKNVKYKSKTTIQKVFVVMQLTGFEYINDNL